MLTLIILIYMYTSTERKLVKILIWIYLALFAFKWCVAITFLIKWLPTIQSLLQQSNIGQ